MRPLLLFTCLLSLFVSFALALIRVLSLALLLALSLVFSLSLSLSLSFSPTLISLSLSLSLSPSLLLSRSLTVSLSRALYLRVLQYVSAEVPAFQQAALIPTDLRWRRKAHPQEACATKCSNLMAPLLSHQNPKLLQTVPARRK